MREEQTSSQGPAGCFLAGFAGTEKLVVAFLQRRVVLLPGPQCPACGLTVLVLPAQSRIGRRDLRRCMFLISLRNGESFSSGVCVCLLLPAPGIILSVDTDAKVGNPSSACSWILSRVIMAAAKNPNQNAAGNRISSQRIPRSPKGSSKDSCITKDASLLLLILFKCRRCTSWV